ncbi:MAG: response regulator [Myxococcales bacterium]|nr:response regulator [Myxococcales bacterium]
MPLVMIIEDEPVLRSSMSRGLARLPDIEVIDAGLFRDAVRLLDVERPDLIVSDLDLPDGSGVEILGVLDRLGRRIPVVFVTAYLGSFRGQLPNRKDVEVYEKPLPLARLREVVLRHFKAAGAEVESPFTLADYLQLACMGRHSVRLEVVRRGETAGSIEIYRGQVWAARAGEARGEAAIAQLAFSTPGASTMVRRTNEDPGARDVHRPWQHVLLNAARLHDEAVRDRGSRPDDSGELLSGLDDALGIRA